MKIPAFLSVWSLTRIGLHGLFLQIGLLYQVLHFDFKPRDVFILDNVSDDEKQARLYQRKLDALQFFWNAAQNKNSATAHGFRDFAKKMLRYPLWLIGPKFFSARIDKVAQKYNSTTTDNVGYMCYSTDRDRSTFSRKMIGEGALLDFDGMKLLAPIHWDKYLTILYGDYMRLPSPEHRVSHHLMEAYWK